MGLMTTLHPTNAGRTINPLQCIPRLPEPSQYGAEDYQAAAGRMQQLARSLEEVIGGATICHDRSVGDRDPFDPESEDPSRVGHVIGIDPEKIADTMLEGVLYAESPNWPSSGTEDPKGDFFRRSWDLMRLAAQEVAALRMRPWRYLSSLPYGGAHGVVISSSAIVPFLGLALKARIVGKLLRDREVVLRTENEYFNIGWGVKTGMDIFLREVRHEDLRNDMFEHASFFVRTDHDQTRLTVARRSTDGALVLGNILSASFLL